MMGIKVAADRSSTEIIKASFESLSIPPKTHFPDSCLPRWYFLLPNLLSSISTICPGPPIGSGLARYLSTQRSRKKFFCCPSQILV